MFVILTPTLCRGNNLMFFPKLNIISTISYPRFVWSFLPVITHFSTSCVPPLPGSIICHLSSTSLDSTPTVVSNHHDHINHPNYAVSHGCTLHNKSKRVHPIYIPRKFSVPRWSSPCPGCCLIPRLSSAYHDVLFFLITNPGCPICIAHRHGSSRTSGALCSTNSRAW